LFIYNTQSINIEELARALLGQTQNLEDEITLWGLDLESDPFPEFQHKK
jgi:hypothetical protein